MVKKLYRSEDDKIIAGLCGGIADFFEIDSTIVRIIFIILTIWGFVGIVLYIIGILVVPLPPTAETSKKEKHDIGDKVNEIANEIRTNVKNSRRGTLRGETVFGLIILLLGVLMFTNNLFPRFGLELFWPLVIIFIGIWILSGSIRKGGK